MSMLALLAIWFCLASAFGFINRRFLHLPSSIGLMVVALAASFVIIALNAFLPAANLRERITDVLGTENLPETLLNGALCFLLFAGALQVELAELWTRKITVFLLATLGVVITAGLFGAGIYLVFRLTSAEMPLAWAIVLGAILAPTDPVAVGAMLARIGLPKRLQAVMAGESLFNDGIGVVVFNTSLAYAVGGQDLTWTTTAADLVREVGGGLLVGGITGWIAYQAMKRLDDYPLEIMISLALATGAYVLANRLGASGPIAVVVAGLLIGSRGRQHAMSEQTRRNLALFWSVIDEILNALLFILLGFEMLGLSHLGLSTVIAMAVAIPLSVAVRAVSIIVTVFWLHARNPDRWPAIAVLTWGGVRGGISVALALSLPWGDWKSDILAVCYAVVVFTIVVQGLTLEAVIGRVYGEGKSS